MSMSNHGDKVLIGTPSTGRFKTRDPTMFCIHVVPHLEGVEMTMSSSLKRNRSQRALSAKNPRYRRTLRSYGQRHGARLPTQPAYPRQSARNSGVDVDAGQVGLLLQ